LRRLAAAGGPWCSQNRAEPEIRPAKFALRGIEVAPCTIPLMFMLDAGRSSHDLGQLSQRYFDHATIDLNDIAGSETTLPSTGRSRRPNMLPSKSTDADRGGARRA
jgi:hypothetical protein